MTSQLILEAEEVKQAQIREAPPSTTVSGERQDIMPGAMKVMIVTLSLTALYLVVSAAWVWFAMYRYQNCL